MNRNKIILERENTALLIIDIQEKILKAMLNHEDLLENVIKLVKGVKVLEIPTYFTEQYPKGLGNTVKEIKDELNGEAIQKMSFSCFGADNLFEKLKMGKISQVIVSGIETLVCVQQTVLDLLSNGFQVNVLADAVASRKQIDKEIALSRMEKHGAEITTHEVVLFELLGICGTHEFKEISKIIK